MLRAITLSLLMTAMASNSFGQENQAGRETKKPELQVSSLEEAYQKEFIFLRKQKSLLEERLRRQEQNAKKTIDEVNQSIGSLQRRHFELKTQVEQKNRELTRLEGELIDFDEQKANLENTLLQSNTSLEKLGYEVADDGKGFVEKLSFNFQQGTRALSDLNQVRQETGEFFLADGRKVTGDIQYIGQVAAFGKSDSGSGALAPAGLGKLKVWISPEGNRIPVPDNQNQSDSISLFVFDSLEKDYESRKAKEIMDTLQAGGMIGWVITGLGFVALLTIAIRALILRKAQSSQKTVEGNLEQYLAQNDFSGAEEMCQKAGGSTASLVSLALRNLGSPKFEDIVSEGYIEQSNKIDRFSTFILVVSAVAPLLGLLGTVTGMIATFDIITEIGTGDPKLLSSGISEALVTTMLGLIVAIPALLLGNMLTSWGENLKGDMEKLVLRVSNAFSKA
ncbi:MotA/TolQ/ExbB proton channel family protein [Pseudobacteriovorax antillogorgiicola]|uniref:Outer membrane transport energization protein ExbB n=1 Tax=Pseudobacteriovorax antillogorgiicola TaxID=1513793 RepID=A0A1Y6CAT8_9BACT|nr:MotA/TolQ/ExbB proton channel family protein [Pseudobacteriovorax antillogorgiicola]TCS48714.1 outer membrane transport energization protein ExbB [Pseudobacteriovorax antillogorgiicola]SMF54595.1 outer membrane transport energization protein ExbB [Pseudobacteriovorax antillogorgiicola]